MNNERLGKILLPLITFLLIFNIVLELRSSTTKAQNNRQYSFAGCSETILKNMARNGWKFVGTVNDPSGCFIVLEK